MQNKPFAFFEKSPLAITQTVYTYLNSRELIQQYKAISNISSRRATILTLLSRTDTDSIEWQSVFFETWLYYPQLVEDYDYKNNVFKLNTEFLGTVSIHIRSTMRSLGWSRSFHRLNLLCVLGKMQNIPWTIADNVLTRLLYSVHDQPKIIRNMFAAVRLYISPQQRTKYIRRLQSDIIAYENILQGDYLLRAWSLLDIFAPDVSDKDRATWIDKFFRDFDKQFRGGNVFDILNKIPALLSYLNQAQFDRMIELFALLEKPDSDSTYSYFDGSTITSIQNIIARVDRSLIHSWFDKLIQDTEDSMCLESVSYLSACKHELNPVQWRRLFAILEQAFIDKREIPALLWTICLEYVDTTQLNQSIKTHAAPDVLDFFSTFPGKVLCFMPARQKVHNLFSAENFDVFFERIYSELQQGNLGSNDLWLSSFHFFMPHVTDKKKQAVVVMLISKLYTAPKKTALILKILAPYYQDMNQKNRRACELKLIRLWSNAVNRVDVLKFISSTSTVFLEPWMEELLSQAMIIVPPDWNSVLYQLQLLTTLYLVAPRCRSTPLLSTILDRCYASMSIMPLDRAPNNFCELATQLKGEQIDTLFVWMDINLTTKPGEPMYGDRFHDSKFWKCVDLWTYTIQHANERQREIIFEKIKIGITFEQIDHSQLLNRWTRFIYEFSLYATGSQAQLLLEHVPIQMDKIKQIKQQYPFEWVCLEYYMRAIFTVLFKVSEEQRNDFCFAPFIEQSDDKDVSSFLCMSVSSGCDVASALKKTSVPNDLDGIILTFMTQLYALNFPPKQDINAEHRLQPRG